jgi:hypothetical protein
MQAAKVAAVCIDINTEQKMAFWNQLSECIAAASWLWPALVAAMIAEGWNVETARAQAGRLKDALAQDIATDRMAKVVVDVATIAGTASRSSAASVRPTPHPGDFWSRYLMRRALAAHTRTPTFVPARRRRAGRQRLATAAGMLCPPSSSAVHRVGPKTIEPRAGGAAGARAIDGVGTDDRARR